MVEPDEILAFWLDEIGPAGWYQASDALDTQIREKFETVWQGAMEGRHALWLTYPSGTLAYLILMDQFPRNMFRGSGMAFKSDRVALAAAKSAISKGYDQKIDAPARQFFYLPLMHSENLCDQDRCVRLMQERMPEADGNLLHARVHREIIRKFGRFPYRNAALARHDTAPEQDFMSNGGYGETLQNLQKAS
ncbi:DUF924 family protein [Marinovum sp. 2_MG-2023]|uniref:DUF924 family protein n=1 Tax=Roseobacteraceae TaxID=2854170 RepID=UPI001FD4A9DC|nr:MULTISPECIES: DUF924 family protein [Roseobacteraceae]MCJ7873627.1 DUF924 domain-containing protein [Phaeobacter sp. J2-8]MDO6730414.1 DUF924 family protein [Marinovum sp. 2_MG-2023]MDO6778394.1 DUF924 family protein [Marinovum sp. 1_MG-2023]